MSGNTWTTINGLPVIVNYYAVPYRPATRYDPAEGEFLVEEIWALDDFGKKVFNVAPYLDDNFIEKFAENLEKELATEAAEIRASARWGI